MAQVIPLTGSAPTQAQVNSSASAQLLAANTSRRGLVIVNVGGGTVSFGVGQTAVLQNGITLVQNGVWEMDQYTFSTAAINGIASSSTFVAVQEFTP